MGVIVCMTQTLFGRSLRSPTTEAVSQQQQQQRTVFTRMTKKNDTTAKKNEFVCKKALVKRSM